MKKILGILLIIGITFMINMETGEITGFENQAKGHLIIQCYPSKDKVVMIDFERPPITLHYYLFLLQAKAAGWLDNPDYIYSPLTALPRPEF